LGLAASVDKSTEDAGEVGSPGRPTVSFGYVSYFSDTNRAIPKAAAAANPPITMVRTALGASGIPVK
jgi:hypothetical protein